MKKLYNTCLIVCLVSIYATSIAQKTPYFYFKKRVYKENFVKEFIQSLKPYEIKLPKDKQLAIAKSLLNRRYLKRLRSYSPKTLTNKQRDGYPTYPRYWILDFNQDRKPDIVMLYNVYFGPSPGYLYFFRKADGTYEYLLDGMGEIYVLLSNKKRTVIQHDLGTIEGSESEIVRTIDINHQKQTYKLVPKLYFASETPFPKSIDQNPKLMRVKRLTNLRFSPEVKDTLTEKDKPGEYIDNTKTLKGNIIAKYKAGAQAYYLATKGDWTFVAFLPNTTLIKTSLRHGMDEDFDSKTGKATGPRVKPYICGWVPSKVFK
ncbi:hypothetical protein BKI52_00610 [marine bacterium AO1-C]|nr:hypothetical protein BKI52_00610 [marine bacterium AO1-C]